MSLPHKIEIMDKVLGQEYNLKDRVSFLRDNCDAVEDLGYTKSLPNDEIEALKDRLVENNIQLRDVRSDKKAANKEFNDQIKQLEESNDEVTGKLKAKPSRIMISPTPAGSPLATISAICCFTSSLIFCSILI